MTQLAGYSNVHNGKMKLAVIVHQIPNAEFGPLPSLFFTIHKNNLLCKNIYKNPSTHTHTH